MQKICFILLLFFMGCAQYLTEEDKEVLEYAEFVKTMSWNLNRMTSKDALKMYGSSVSNIKILEGQQYEWLNKEKNEYIKLIFSSEDDLLKEWKFENKKYILSGSNNLLTQKGNNFSSWFDKIKQKQSFLLFYYSEALFFDSIDEIKKF